MLNIRWVFKNITVYRQEQFRYPLFKGYGTSSTHSGYGVGSHYGTVSYWDNLHMGAGCGYLL